MHVSCVASRFLQDEQKEVIEKFSFLPFEGKVDLKAAQHSFSVVIQGVRDGQTGQKTLFRMAVGRDVSELDNIHCFCLLCVPERKKAAGG